MKTCRVRFEEDTSNMSLDEVMIYFGVPEAKTVAIHKALHPAKGAATASLDEKARRKAAHAVALERYNELSWIWVHDCTDKYGSQNFARSSMY